MNISHRDNKMFAVALSAAETSTHNRTRVGAVLSDGRDIVAVGINKRHKTHPLQMKYNAFRHFQNDNGTISHCLHAEIDALVKVRSIDIRGMRVYVARVTKNGNVGLARPCPACMNALRDFGIREVFYTTDRGFAYEEIKR